MPSIYKPFDRNLYTLADTQAKTIITSWLEKQGHKVTAKKENYSCDLTTEKDGEVHNVEVEIKFSWKGQWPDSWKEIRIPYRKKKLLGTKNLTFYVLRSDCKQVWEIPATILETVATVKEVTNRYVKNGEKFFHVPVEHATLLNV